MAKKQTRRSISFALVEFDAAVAAAQAAGIPVAQIASKALATFLSADPVAVLRPCAEQVVIDDLAADSPFRHHCRLAGCSARPGQACRPVGHGDAELAVGRVHQNRLWQAKGAIPIQGDPGEVKREISDAAGISPEQVEPVGGDLYMLPEDIREKIEAAQRVLAAMGTDATTVRRIDGEIPAGFPGEIPVRDPSQGNGHGEISVVYDDAQPVEVAPPQQAKRRRTR